MNSVLSKRIPNATTRPVHEGCFFASRVLLAALTCFSAGCGVGADGPPCNSARDCDTVCVANEGYIVYGSRPGQGSCALPCESTADCAEPRVCSLSATADERGASAACLPPCVEENLAPGWICQGDEALHCDVANPDIPCTVCCAPGESCAMCNAPGHTGSFCDQASGECTPSRQAGERCAFDIECSSRDCAGVCLRPQGWTCTGDNCTNCGVRGDTTYCHTECDSADDCPSHATRCMGFPATGNYWCYEEGFGVGTCPSGYIWDVEWSYCKPFERVCGSATTYPGCQ
jgi:hypothetical protein